MKILIATDGSDFSKAAVEECCRVVAKPETASIQIVSAVDLIAPVPAEPFMVSADYIHEMDALAHKQAERWIQQAEILIRQCFPNANLDLTSKVANGSPDRVIIEEAARWGADLIVVGSHGYGFWERMMLGSVSQSVMQHAPCSVLVVRRKAKK
jgi:nucleotide-binding universal stress UspA family protein